LRRRPQGYHSIAKRFFDEAGFQHVALLTADGALEAAPAMGCADIILDLVSTGEWGWVGIVVEVCMGMANHKTPS
jgi:hypothetical protein